MRRIFPVPEGRRLLRALLWLTLGNAIGGALYWWLLNVPESQAWMVGLTALLAIVIVLWLGVVHGAAAAAWLPETTLQSQARAGVLAVPMFLLGALLFAAAWWVTGRAWQFVGGRSGEIEAWLIAHLRSTRNAWVQVVVDSVLYFVRYAVGGAIWAAAVGAAAAVGIRAAALRWLRPAFSRRLIGAPALLAVVLIVLPLRAVYWRPAGLPSTGMEPVFVAAKLGFVYLCVSLAVALILKMALVETSRRLATPLRGPLPPGNIDAPDRTRS